MAFKLSAIGRENLRTHEGVVPYVYDDKRGAGFRPTSWAEIQGYPTIGMGRLIQPHEYDRFAPYLAGRAMPSGELTKLIDETIRPREEQLNKLLGKAPVTQSMFDALFSFMYNTGAGNRSFRNAVAALTQKDVKGRYQPDYTAAVAAIANGPVTSKGQVLAGLVRRRAEEAARFMADGVPGGLRVLLSSKSTQIFLSVGAGLGVLAGVIWFANKRRD